MYVLYIHINRQGSFTNHTPLSLYIVMITGTNVVGEMNMGNIAPMTGLKPTRLSIMGIEG